MLDAVRELARAAEEARRGPRKALEAIHRYRQTDRWERYAAQEALLGDVLRRLGEIEKELERCIVLNWCTREDLEGLKRRYDEVRRALEQSGFGKVGGAPEG